MAVDGQDLVSLFERKEVVHLQDAIRPRLPIDCLHIDIHDEAEFVWVQLFVQP